MALRLMAMRQMRCQRGTLDEGRYLPTYLRKEWKQASMTFSHYAYPAWYVQELASQR